MKTPFTLPIAAALAAGSLTFSALAETNDDSSGRQFTPTIGVNPSAGDVSAPAPTSSDATTGTAAEDALNEAAAREVERQTRPDQSTGQENAEPVPSGAPSTNGNPANATTNGDAGAPSMNGHPSSSGATASPDGAGASGESSTSGGTNAGGSSSSSSGTSAGGAGASGSSNGAAGGGGQ